MLGRVEGALYELQGRANRRNPRERGKGWGGETVVGA